MKFKDVTTGRIYDSWNETNCDRPEGGCEDCIIHRVYNRYFENPAMTWCSDIVEKYPEAARLIGYEPVYDTPQPESGMDAKLLDFFKQTYDTLNKGAFCWGVSCGRCPFNTPLGQPCGANQIMKAMEKMAGASELKE